MRKIFFFCLFAFAGMTSRAQDPRRHRDTLHFGGGGLPELMKAPVLTGQSQPIIIMPDRMESCFQKELDLKMSVGGRMLEQTVYLNTEKGLTGILPPSPGGGAVTEIMPELEHFNFIVMSMKGNVYIYKNSKGKNGIEHLVSTGNTQSYLYQSPERQGNGTPLARKSGNRSYCNGQITAQAYKFDGGASTWYMYGDRFPAQLHPLKYIGAFGVGYIFCQEGLYLIMELEFANTYVRIGNMYNMNACFDPSGFVVMEDKFQIQQQEAIARERTRNDEDAAKVTGTCVAEKMAVINFKRAMTDKQEELTRRAHSGNMYTDTAAQHAMLALTDPTDNARLGILQAQQSLCSAESATPKTPQESANQQSKIQCLQDQIRKLTDAVAQMEALDRQYAGHPEVANPNKSRVYLRIMSMAPGCN